MKLNIRNKITILILGLFVIIYVTSVGYVLYRMYERNISDAENIVISNAKELSNSVKNEISKVIYITKTFTGSFETRNEFPYQVKNDFQLILLKKVVKDNPDILSAFMSRQIFSYDPTWKHEYGRLKQTYFHKDGEIHFESEVVEKEGEIPGTDYNYIHKTNKEYITEPYWDEYNDGEKMLMTSICIPVKDKGEFVGLAGTDISLDNLKNLIINNDNHFNSSSFIISNKGTYIYNADSTMIGHYFNESDKTIDSVYNISDKIKAGKDLSFYYKDTIDNKNYFYSIQPICFGGEFLPWAIGVKIRKNKIISEARAVIMQSAFFGFIAMLIFLVVIFFIASSFTKPIKKIVEFSGEIAQGNLKAKLDLGIRKDEFSFLQKHLETMADNLVTVINKVKDTAALMSDNSSFMRKISDEVLAGTGKQAASAEEVSAAMEQMIAMIEQNTIHADKTAGIALKSSESITESEQNVSKTAELMGRIAIRIQELDDIAFHVNLLALNTAIEASHAGEFGKGFTAVAREVKNLALKSKQAAKEIGILSSESVLMSEKSVDFLKEIIPGINETASLVKNISVSGKEQSGGAVQVNTSVHSLNSVIQQNSSNAEKMLDNSKKFEKLANEFNELISFFRT